jgi:RNA polymerase sigma-70 factor (ECF subfamily)
VTPAETNAKSGAAPNASWFATTHWTVILSASDSSLPGAQQALEQLCRTYWYPLYAYARRRGYGPHDAEDLVQGFFARLIEKQTLQGLERGTGRFRSYLLTCFNHFVGDEQDRAGRLKRGGGREIISLDAQLAEGRYQLEPPDLQDPEKIFERRWALTVLDRVLARLRMELEAEGKGQCFQHLQALVVGEPGAGRQAEVAARLGWNEGTVAVALHRLRRSYRRVLREEIAQTVQRVEEVDDEMRHLLAVLRG